MILKKWYRSMLINKSVSLSIIVSWPNIVPSLPNYLETTQTTKMSREWEWWEICNKVFQITHCAKPAFPIFLIAMQLFPIVQKLFHPNFIISHRFTSTDQLPQSSPSSFCTLTEQIFSNQTKGFCIVPFASVAFICVCFCWCVSLFNCSRRSTKQGYYGS